MAVEEYTKLKKKFCDFMTALNAQVLLPTCVDCYTHKQHLLEEDTELPDITKYNWEEDLAWELGLTDSEIQEIKNKIENCEDLEVFCHECRGRIYYGEDDCYIKNSPFSEYFFVPESKKKKPSRELKKRMIKLYGKTCYACGKKLTKGDASADHIVARIHGGLTSALNLQILCRKCDNEVKKGRKASIVNIILTFLFRPPPSDAYEGIIW